MPASCAPPGGPPNGTAAAAAAAELVLSFGVNDCESRLGVLPLARVWDMLTPLPGAKDACL